MLKAAENSAFRTEVTELSFQQVMLKVLQVQTRFSCKKISYSEHYKRVKEPEKQALLFIYSRFLYAQIRVLLY